MKPSAASAVLRLAMAATFLSAVGSRLEWWGRSGWAGFLQYAAEVNSYAPAAWVPTIAVTATALELLLAVFLVAGFKTRLVAGGSCFLTLCFALAMTYSFGLKSPFDYSVWVDSAAMYVLATLPPSRWSIDAVFARRSMPRIEQPADEGGANEDDG